MKSKFLPVLLLSTPLMHGAEAPNESFSVTVGGAVLSAPAFLGAKDYQVMAVPSVRIEYGNRFFASVEEGVGGVLWSDSGFEAGPLLRYQFARREDGDGPFRIAGDETTALRGLGDVKGTLEAGAFLRYRLENWRFSLRLLQGLGGHEGWIADAGVRGSWNVSRLFWDQGPPVILSAGPSLRLAGDRYVSSYFGITEAQSTASGLAKYEAGAGLLDYGLGGSVLVPLGGGWSAGLLGKYSRLAGDAADSPLVVQRGSADQWMFGLTVGYRFGDDPVRE